MPDQNRPKVIVTIISGSPRDKDWVDRIVASLEELGVPNNWEVFSMDKTPLELLEFLRGNDMKFERVVYIAVAGLCNALAGIDFHTRNPVISCPPLGNDPWAPFDVFSSLRKPSGIGALTILRPDGAALAAAKILGHSDETIALAVESYQQRLKEEVHK